MQSKKLFILLILAMALLLITSACSAESSAAETEGSEHADDDDDHDNMAHAHVDPPDEFASLTNPFDDDHEAVEAGEELFNTYCATCHGAAGQGDGPGAANLDPQPADLSDGAMMHDLSDGYLYWRVSKGGAMAPFNSAMPAWESGLTEEQRWQIISFVRSLSDEAGDRAADDDHDAEHDDEHTD